MNKEIAIETAKILIKIDAVSFRFDPPFTYTTGLKSPIYLDNRIIMSHPDQREQIINYYIQILTDKVGLDKFNYISGTATAAVPQASWVAGKLHLPMIYVRPSTKSYGKETKLEGYLKAGAHVVIIEDHVSTATSIVGNAQTIREFKGNVQYCVATTTYETESSKLALKKAGIILFALTTGKMIVEEALRQKKITLEQKSLVDLWFENPTEWAKNTGYE